MHGCFEGGLTRHYAEADVSVVSGVEPSPGNFGGSAILARGGLFLK